MNITIARNSGDVNIDNVDLFMNGLDTDLTGIWESSFGDKRTKILFVGNPPFAVYHTKEGFKRVVTGEMSVKRLTNKILMGEVLTS